MSTDGLHLACLRCGSDLPRWAPADWLRSSPLQGNDVQVLECGHCEGRYPVVAQTPILLRDARGYLARYRDAIVALAATTWGVEASFAQALDLLIAQASENPQSFARDFTDSEIGTGPLPYIGNGGARAEVMRQLRRSELEDGLVARVRGAVPQEGLARGLELGPGAGLLSVELAGRFDEFWLGDLSLAALWASALRVQREVGTRAIAVVLDAEDADFTPERIDCLIACNLVDLLEEPKLLIQGSSRWLSPGGLLVVSSPEPSLGTDSDSRLRLLVEEIGFSVNHSYDELPWLREHTSRYAQIYWAQLLVARL